MTPFRPNVKKKHKNKEKNFFFMIFQSRGDNFDQKQQLSLDGETNEDIIQQNALLLKRHSVQSK